MELGSLVSSGLAVLSAGLLTVAAAPVPPALTTSPRVVQPGESVTINGSSFGPCPAQAAQPTIDLFADSSELTRVSGTSSAFQLPITVPAGTAGGPWVVTAQCSSNLGQDLASVTVQVVTLVLSSGSGLPGTAISATGSGYAGCREVQAELIRDGTEAVAESSPVDAPGGTFDAQLTVPASALPGGDYQVEDTCDPGPSSVALVAGALAAEPFTVTAVAASPSPAASSPSPPPSPRTAPGSPSPTPSSASRPASSVSPSLPTPPRLRSGGGPWTPAALIGGTGAGVVLIALAAVRASSLGHGRRGRAWIRKHMRAVAGPAGSVSADVRERPGAASISVGLEPHPDPIGHQQGEETGQ